MDENSKDIDRRLFLKRGATIAWAAPTILTLMATSAAASHGPTCIHTGDQCGFFDTTTSTCIPPGGGEVCCAGLTCTATGTTQGAPCTCTA